MYMKRIVFLFLIDALLLCSILLAADKDGGQKAALGKLSQVSVGPIVDNDVKWHQVGAIWSRVTNYSKTGDDAYEGRTPSGDWPGGSGNSYLYRGSLWLTAKVDGVVHSTQTEDNEYAPIAPVTQIFDGPIAKSQTFTKYYDVKAPLASGHFPLGVEVTERTYAWAESFRDDFIIYEYVIKNVGIDSDDDGYPETPRDLNEFYFTYRLDGDVSKLPDWAAESRFSNQDDHAGVNSSWGLLDLYPDWKKVADSLEALGEDPLGEPDSSLFFMWDGDNPSYPAYDGGPDNDLFNPGINGGWQTPGFLGIRILKTVPASFKPSSFHTNHIYNDPATDQESYDRMMAPKEFEKDGPSGVLINPKTKIPFPNDYRAVMSLGPLDTFHTGDSITVVCALGVGADSVHAGIYSLMELVKIMRTAKRMVDDNYQIVVRVAPPPTIEVKEMLEGGITKGLRLRWSKTPEDSSSFLGYKVWKSSGRDQNNNFVWKPFGKGVYTKNDTASWPPPVAVDDATKYELTDTDVVKGFDYYYSVQSFSEDPDYGYSESAILANAQTVIPANPPKNDLNKIKVVPNPYIGSARWNNPRPSDADAWQHRIQFTNIPADATIKIFTLDLDFVAEIKAGDIARVSKDFIAPTNYGVAEWDLITRNNQEAAPGIYIYVVDSPSAGQKTGKFVIVR